MDVDMPRFAHTENIDFRLRKSDKWVRSTEGWEGVRQNGLISLSKCKSYLNDGEMERRDESGLKLIQPPGRIQPTHREMERRDESGLKRLHYHCACLPLLAGEMERRDESGLKL